MGERRDAALWARGTSVSALVAAALKRIPALSGNLMLRDDLSELSGAIHSNTGEDVGRLKVQEYCDSRKHQAHEMIYHKASRVHLPEGVDLHLTRFEGCCTLYDTRLPTMCTMISHMLIGGELDSRRLRGLQ